MWNLLNLKFSLISRCQLRSTQTEKKVITHSSTFLVSLITDPSLRPRMACFSFISPLSSISSECFQVNVLWKIWHSRQNPVLQMWPDLKKHSRALLGPSMQAGVCSCCRRRCWDSQWSWIFFRSCPCLPPVLDAVSSSEVLSSPTIEFLSRLIHLISCCQVFVFLSDKPVWHFPTPVLALLS